MYIKKHVPKIEWHYSVIEGWQMFDNNIDTNYRLGINPVDDTVIVVFDGVQEGDEETSIPEAIRKATDAYLKIACFDDLAVKDCVVYSGSSDKWYVVDRDGDQVLLARDIRWTNVHNVEKV